MKLIAMAMSVVALLTAAICCVSVSSDRHIASLDTGESAELLVVYGQRRQDYQLHGERIDGVHIGGIGFAVYEVDTVIHGHYSNRIVVVGFFTNSVPKDGLAEKAMLILAEPFFPYPQSELSDNWAIGGDAYRGICPLNTVETNDADSIMHTQLATNPHIEWIPEARAIEIATAHPVTSMSHAARNHEVLATKRYPFGWIIEIRPFTSAVGDYWIIVVGDDGVVKDVIGGL